MGIIKQFIGFVGSIDEIDQIDDLLNLNHTAESELFHILLQQIDAYFSYFVISQRKNPPVITRLLLHQSRYEISWKFTFF